VLELTGGELLNLSLHDPSRNCMLNRYWKKDQESGEFVASPADEAASGWAWKHQEPITIPDIEREQRFPGCVPVLLNHGIRSLTVLPVSTPSQHFGALGLGRSVPEVLASEDMEFLSRVALMGAFALEKEKALYAFEEQQSLFSISRDLSFSLELDKLLPVILASVRNIARYDRTLLSLMDEDGKHLHIYGNALEWEPFFNHGTVVPLEHSLSSRAIQTRKATLVSADQFLDIKDPMAKVMHALAFGRYAACR
jgi:GAF domain-containing protein